FHEVEIYDAQLSSDGSRLLARSEGGYVTRLYNTATQAPIAAFAPETSVTAAAFSGNGKGFATGSDDCFVRFWKSVDGTTIGQPAEMDSPIWQLAFHPTRPIIAISTEKTILTLYDFQKREKIAVQEPLDVKSKNVKRTLRCLQFS